MGVGSEVYAAVRSGRKGIGIELKPSYYRQAERNIEQAVNEAVSGDNQNMFAESEASS
jgi:DNA modification methylase